MPLIKNQGRYGELGHWGKRSGRRFSKKKIILLGTLLSLSLIFAISHNGNIIPIVNADYNSSFSHTRTLIFGDTVFNPPITVGGTFTFHSALDGFVASGTTINFITTIAASGDTIILGVFGTGSFTGFTVTDTQSNVFTKQVQAVTATGNPFTTIIFTTPSATIGADTITLSTAGGGNRQFGGVELDYSGITGFGNTATDQNDVAPNAYTSTVTLTASAGSHAIEMIGVLSGAAGATVTAASSQTSRSTISSACGTTTACLATDVSVVAGSNSLSFTSNISMCPTCIVSHSALEVLGGQPATLNTSKVRWAYNTTCVTVNSNIVFDYAKGTSGSGGSNCSSADIAITKSPYNFQTVAGRMFELITAWQNNAGVKLANLTFVMRTNGTLPSFTENYNPMNDAQARLVWTLCPTYLCSGGVQAIYIAHDQSKNIKQETLANDLIISGAAPQLNATNIPFGAQAVLNFTGPNNYINEYTSALTTNVSNNTASGLQFGQSYYVMVQSTFLTSLSPCGGCNTATIAFGPSGGVTVRSMSLWSVPSSCTDVVNKVACGFGTATPVFQFNPLDPSSWGNAIIQGLLWVFTVAVPSGLRIVAAVLLQFLDSTFNFVGQQLGWGNIGDNIVTFINGLPSLFGQVGAVLGNLASIVSSVINTIIIANLLANPYFAGLVNILNDIKNVLSSGLVINFLTEIAIWFPTSYMIILIATYFLFVLLKGLHGFFDWIHIVKWSSFQMVGLFSLFIYVFGKLITAMLGRMSIISPGHEFPHIPHPDPGELPKIHLNGEVAFFDDPTAWFLGFTGFIFTMMWAGTSAAGLPANTQTIIQSFSGLFLTLFGVGFMILMLYIPGFLLGKLYQKGIIS